MRRDDRKMRKALIGEGLTNLLVRRVRKLWSNWGGGDERLSTSVPPPPSSPPPPPPPPHGVLFLRNTGCSWNFLFSSTQVPQPQFRTVPLLPQDFSFFIFTIFFSLSLSCLLFYGWWKFSFSVGCCAEFPLKTFPQTESYREAAPPHDQCRREWRMSPMHGTKNDSAEPEMSRSKSGRLTENSVLSVSSLRAGSRKDGWSCDSGIDNCLSGLLGFLTSAFIRGSSWGKIIFSANKELCH